jgi:hypothetical protein
VTGAAADKARAAASAADLSWVKNLAGSSCVASGSLSGCPVARSFLGEPLELPFIHAGQPILAERGRWADARVIGSMAVTQGMHVRAIQFDPSAYLVSSADGPVTGDEDINVVRHALK